MKIPSLRALTAALVILVLQPNPSFAQRAEDGSPAFLIEQSPPDARRGERVSLSIRFDGISASTFRVESIRLGSGLSLETQSVRPYTSHEGRYGAELRLGLILGPSGNPDIESLSLVAEGSRFTIGRIAVNILDASSGWEGSAPVWKWSCPSEVRLYQSFELRLLPPGGRPLDKDIRVVVDPPSGAAFERSGGLVWTVTAIEEGVLELPRATIYSRGESALPIGEAPAVSITVRGNEKKVTELESGDRGEGGAPMREKSGGDAVLGPAQGTTDGSARDRSQGAALASLYRTLRTTLFFESAHREARAAASKILASIGRELRPNDILLDTLPPPKLFITLAAVCAAAALLTFLFVRRRNDRPERKTVVRRMVPLVLCAVFVCAALLGLASALEHRTVYAVVWTGEARAIPSVQAELVIKIDPASTARLGSSAADFCSLTFADGVEAWVPSESIFTY